MDSPVQQVLNQNNQETSQSLKTRKTDTRLKKALRSRPGPVQVKKHERSLSQNDHEVDNDNCRDDNVYKVMVQLLHMSAMFECPHIFGHVASLQMNQFLSH